MNEELNHRFSQAILKKDIFLARSLATMFETGSTQNEAIRLSAYRQVMLLALESGEGMAAAEVAPFAGHEITKSQYLECMKVALKLGKYDDVIWCSHGCEEIPDLFSSPLAHNLSSSGDFFRDLVHRYIDEEMLPAKTRVLLWLHRQAAVLT